MQKGTKSVLKALAIGVLLIPLNYYWIGYSEMVLHSYPTIVVPFYNVIVSLLFLIASGLLLGKISRKLTLSHRELLIVYIVLSIASSIGSTCMMQELPEVMCHAFRFATENNEWQDLLWRYVPRWLTVDNENVFDSFYEGESSLYRVEHIVPFLKPAFWWFIFVLALLFSLWCINMLLRKQWSEHERLTYPVTQLPYEITNPDLRFFRNKLMWVGFGLAAFISIVNGVSFLHPTIPTIPVKRHSIGHFFTQKPWNAVGSLKISFYPFFIGMSFLMPLDLSFSCWFFYLFYKAELISGSAIGRTSSALHFNEQVFGIFIGVCLVSLWKGRKYLKQALLYSFLRVPAYPPLTQGQSTKEAMRYRSAFAGLIFGIAVLALFSAQIGMSFWTIVVFLAGYFVLSIAITRIRAELGYPVLNLYRARVNSLMVSTLGTRSFSRGSLVGLAMYTWFNVEYEAHPMPIQLESLKLADRVDLPHKRLTWTIMLASAVSIPIGFWIFSHIFYKFGADSGRMDSWVLAHGRTTFNYMENWLTYLTDVNYRGAAFIGIGFIFSLFLMFLRARFLWFPFHPLGYALATGWSMDNLWSCILVSWFAKVIILKYGGLKVHRRAVMFFLGLVLGDFLIGSFWNILSMLINSPTYEFWP